MSHKKCLCKKSLKMWVKTQCQLCVFANNEILWKIFSKKYFSTEVFSKSPFKKVASNLSQDTVSTLSVCQEWAFVDDCNGVGPAQVRPSRRGLSSKTHKDTMTQTHKDTQTYKHTHSNSRKAKQKPFGRFLHFWKKTKYFSVIFWDFSYALFHHCTVAWVTRPEGRKGVKDVIKQARRAAT